MLAPRSSERRVARERERMALSWAEARETNQSNVYGHGRMARPTRSSKAIGAARKARPKRRLPQLEPSPLDFVRDPRAVTLRFLGGRGHHDAVVGAVRAAKVSVWIATANLKEMLVEPELAMPGRKKSYRSVLETLDALAARGVELRILHAAMPSGPFRESFDAYPRLVKGGLEMRLCPRVHLKCVIVDGRSLYLGSANWTGAGLGAKGDRNRNFELGLLTEDEVLLDEVQAIYEHLWTGGACGDCGRRELCEAPLDGRA